MSNDKSVIVTSNGQTYLVQRYRIIGTKEWRVEVYEPTQLGNATHSTVTSHEGRWYGSIASRRLPADISALSVGPGRWEAIRIIRSLRVNELTRVANEALTVPVDATCDGYRLCYAE